jgi:excisionase family DNA binding protein
MLSLQEAADILGVSPPTVRRIIRGGLLRAARIGGQVRIDAGDLRRFVDAARLEPDEATTDEWRES